MENIITSLKQNNKLLNTIRCNPGISKAALADKFDVSWPTISNSIEGCKTSNILIDTQTIQINPNFEHMIGLSIGAAQTKLCIIDMNFDLVASDIFLNFIDNLNIFEKAINYMNENNIAFSNYICFKTPNNLCDFQNTIDSIISDIITLIEHQQHFNLNISSIGLTFTGAIDNLNSKIIKSHNLDFISDKPIENIIFPNRIDYFEQKNINIYIDNNSNSSAIAEKYYLYNISNANHKYRNKQNIMTIYLGAGIGAGMIFNNKLYRGAKNYVGELGHIDVPAYSGNYEKAKTSDKCCSCGNDKCLDFRIRNDVFEMTRSEFSSLSSQEINDYIIAHPKKADILAYYIGYISNFLINILNLDMIIFTGKFGTVINNMWPAIYRQINNNKLSYISNECKLVVSDLGVISPAKGVAICSYFDKIGEDVKW